MVGLNLLRLDFDDPSSARGFSSMKALGRWQWAMQVFAREWNRRSPVAMNIYMPGLVKTKILANEPQPMRLFVQIANVIMGVPVLRAGQELYTVIEDIRTQNRRDSTTHEPSQSRRALKEQPGDGENCGRHGKTAGSVSSAFLNTGSLTNDGNDGPIAARRTFRFANPDHACYTIV